MNSSQTDDENTDIDLQLKYAIFFGVSFGIIIFCLICFFGLQRIKKNECVIVTCGIFCNIILDLLNYFSVKN